ncbi:unnamed protein product [Clavelina lepadiformis]|uniref:Uncharacterized protein n=1 Tax=Clavelina lepadiformis TaxID=159417 RepID=A0ABP0G5S8_CLALP
MSPKGRLRKKSSAAAADPSGGRKKEITKEDLLKKMEVLNKLEEKLKSAEKKAWFGNLSSFQIFYVSGEIFIALCIILLSFYVIQTNKRHQAAINEALQKTKAEMSDGVDGLSDSGPDNKIVYDMDEFCEEQDCDVEKPILKEFNPEPSNNLEDILFT